MRLRDLHHRVGADGADQLGLQVRVASEEAESLERLAREVVAEPCPFERAVELRLLGGVAETGELDVGAVEAEEAADRLCPADRHDDHALRLEVPFATLGKRLDGHRVAGPLDEDDRAWGSGR